MGIQSSSATVRFGTAATGYTVVNDTNDHYLRYVRFMTVPPERQNGADWEAGYNTTPAQIPAIVARIKLLETNAPQKEIYTKMKASTETFGFRDVAHAKARVLQRLETIEMMKAFNVATGSAYNYTTTTIPVSTTATLWEKGAPTDFLFRQKDGTAYNAITQLCTLATTYGECYGAINACVWWGAARSMGETDFNTLYPGTTALNMDYNQSDSWERNIAFASDKNVVVPGDWGYWENGSSIKPGDLPTKLDSSYKSVIKEPYFYKKKWLEDDETKKIYYWSGENALYLGDDLYEGLGVEPKTDFYMREKIRAEYNSDLAKVIQGLARLTPPGIYNNRLEVKVINRADAVVKINFINVKRLRH